MTTHRKNLNSFIYEPKKSIQVFTHFDETKQQHRSMLVANGYSFYKSTGRNSKLSGIWFPFSSICEVKREQIKFLVNRVPVKSGYIYKPPIIYSKSNLTTWINDQKIADIVATNKKIFYRFGNLEAMLISYALDEKAWIDNFENNPALKKIYDCINANKTYTTFIEEFRAANTLDESKTTYYVTSKPKDMQKLNAALVRQGKIYDYDSFPQHDHAMAKRISIVFRQVSNFLADLALRYDKPIKSEMINQCIRILDITNSEEVMQEVFKLAIAIALQMQGFALTNTASLGILVKNLVNDEKYSNIHDLIHNELKLSPETNNIRYRDLRSFCIEQNSEEKKSATAFFSRRHEKAHFLAIKSELDRLEKQESPSIEFKQKT